MLVGLEAQENNRGEVTNKLFIREDGAVLCDCLWAVVWRLPDGTVECPLIDNMGCEECYEAWENSRRYDENKSIDDAS